MGTNFAKCLDKWNNLSEHDRNHLAWHGKVVRIDPDPSMQISLAGCRKLCGTGNNYYDWAQQASTITTWVLPIMGILLQAPFSSNAFLDTVFSLARWVGSPMASLSYIFWNIKVSGKCALLVDLSIPYKEQVKEADTDFGKIRDSFYLLMTMNQYTMIESVRERKEAEGLLRIVLFSQDLRLLKIGQKPVNGSRQASPGASSTENNSWPPGMSINGQSTSAPLRPEDDLEAAEYLGMLRQDLANDLRAKRRRGVVPVFISTLWFVFALILSIQAAFGSLGSNSQAHDLALGFLLAWLPVLILSSIVDRNPVAADDIRTKLNELVDRVRLSLMDDTVKHKYFESISDLEDQEKMRNRVQKVSEAFPTLDEFFVSFAGQGRKRFHYGAAHPILTDIEKAYIARKGRHWLRDEREARTRLVLGDISGGLDWLDPRELWQVLSAVVIVGGTILGAFTLSYLTPTVGLGCRSGGYTVFGTVALGLLVVEMVCWWGFDAKKTGLRQSISMGKFLAWYVRICAAFDERSSKIVRASQRSLFRQLSRHVSDKLANAIERRLDDQWDAWQKMTAQKRVGNLFFKPIECFNCLWLVYITMAQTTGYYNNCNCKSSTWAGGGGYMDWKSYNTAVSPMIRVNWTISTVISSTIMACAMCYIVTEWCLQSHLSTSDMKSAARGLKWTRRFRRFTSPFRDSMHYLIEAGYILRRLASRQGPSSTSSRPGQERRSVRWTRHMPPPEPPQDPPAVEMSDRTSSRRPSGSSDQPLMTNRDSNSTSPAIMDAPDHSGSQSPRPSEDCPSLPPIEPIPPIRIPRTERSPSLQVPDSRHAFHRRASDS